VSVSQEEIIAGIAEIIEEVTGIEPSEITPEKSFVDDLDIDSLSMVEIAVQTEDKYGVKIPDEDLAGLRTVGDVVNYIQKLRKKTPRPPRRCAPSCSRTTPRPPPTSRRGWKRTASDQTFHC
jgi:acyl carrier protein